jgi:hypothetical protein
MIAESTPFGGIELKQASNDTKYYLTKHHHHYEHDEWERWFGKVINIINEHDVSMWCYINCDWKVCRSGMALALVKRVYHRMNMSCHSGIQRLQTIV